MIKAVSDVVMQADVAVNNIVNNAVTDGMIHVVNHAAV